MIDKRLKVHNEHFPLGYENLSSYCYWLKNKNTVVLHLLENYLEQELSSDERLIEIRNIILDVSGSIHRLPHNIFVGDEDEGL